MAEKLNVLQQIINSDDATLINDIKMLINSIDLDWFDDRKAQQNDVTEGIAQLDKGDVFSHEEAKKKFGY